jgi:hypothetical protein
MDRQNPPATTTVPAAASTGRHGPAAHVRSVDALSGNRTTGPPRRGGLARKICLPNWHGACCSGQSKEGISGAAPAVGGLPWRSGLASGRKPGWPATVLFVERKACLL